MRHPTSEMKIQNLKYVLLVLVIISTILCVLESMRNYIAAIPYEVNQLQPKRAYTSSSLTQGNVPGFCKFKREHNVQSTAHVNEIPTGLRETDIITSPAHTKVTVLNKKSVYKLCDEFVVKVEAKDGLGRDKRYGGDVFRVKLYSKKPYSAVNADGWEDFGNGTYVATFHMFWEGSMILEVLLANSAEAIPLFSPTNNGSRSKLQTYYGVFKSTGIKGKKYSEKRNCSESKLEGPFCNFSDSKNYAPWYCLKPNNEHLNCSHWVAHQQNVPALFEGLRKEIKDGFDDEILKRIRKPVQHQLGEIKVESVDKLHALEGNALPYCKADGPPPLGPNGYFFNNTWWPFGCKVHPFTSEDIRNCLRGRTVRIFGDSTARQFYTFLSKELSCQPLDLSPPRQTNNREYRCKSGDTILHFHFHGLPNGHSSSIPSWANHYTATEIDNLVGGPNLVVLVSHWAHFSRSGLPFFKQRMESVRAALLRLQERAPLTSIVIKGANSRDYYKKEIVLVSSDWHSYQQEKMLREIFKNDKMFGYLNSWEITQAQQYPDNTHPKETIIRNLNNRLMTYVCMNSMMKNTTWGTQ